MNTVELVVAALVAGALLGGAVVHRTRRKAPVAGNVVDMSPWRLAADLLATVDASPNRVSAAIAAADRLGDLPTARAVGASLLAAAGPDAATRAADFAQIMELFQQWDLPAAPERDRADGGEADG